MKEQHSSQKDLRNEKAIEKIKKIVEKNPVCFFTTNLIHTPLQSRPMSTRDVDEEGNLYFLSARTSNKNIDVEDDPVVQLFYANESDSEYLSIYGEARVYADRKTIEENWSNMARVWFDGKNDPDVTVIQVVPKDAYYWDSKSNRMFTLIKMALSATTGYSTEIGEEGKLHLHRP